MRTANGSEHSLQSLYALKQFGWTYPSNFLNIFFEKIDENASHLVMDIEPCFLTASGGISYSVLGVFADVAFSNAARYQLGVDASLATISFSLSVYQLPSHGRLKAISRFEGRCSGTSIKTVFVTVSIEDEQQNVVACGRALMGVSPYKNMVNVQELPMEKRSLEYNNIYMQELDASDQEVIDFSKKCQELAGRKTFIDYFWGGEPMGEDAVSEKIYCMQARKNVSNRAGNIHGGILYGFAASATSSMVPDGWKIVDSSIQYLKAAIGSNFYAHPQITKIGNNTFVVECKVLSDSDKVVVTSQWTFCKSEV